MSFSNVYENKVLNHIFSKDTGLTPMQPISVGLCIEDPGEGATGNNCHELPNTNGYARAVTVEGTWNVSSGGIITNTDTIVFNKATAHWGNVTHFVLLDSSIYGLGNVIFYSPLITEMVITFGYTARFEAGQLEVSLN